MSSETLEECLPLKSLDSVLGWDPSGVPVWSERAEPLRRRSEISVRGSEHCCQNSCRLKGNGVPRTLFCHDMKGGYLEDRFVEGSDKHDSYRFFRWAGVDIFVYFSHSLVTIPPLGWINAGHCHGVTVLGTIITEGQDGRKLWEKVLNDDALTSELINCLALICVSYGFDGYLFNIENNLNPIHAFKLLEFVKSLKSLMSELKPDSMLIWYDAVTLPTGQLNWQNCLNNYNYNFFDVCDGIFLNYNWSEKELARSVVSARNRKFDVYVGVDIFGRGCYGNGGFNTNLAVELIRKHELSVALFAPGWVHENKLESENFLDRELLFWSLIVKHLYLHGISEIPLITSFCQGYGNKMFKNGKVISNKPWYNLLKQNYQPTDLYGHLGCYGDYCLKHTTSDAFNGGSSLLVSSCDDSKHIHRLFLFHYKVHSSEKLEITTVTKQLSPDAKCNLVIVLTLEDESNKKRLLKLTRQFDECNDDDVCDGNVIQPENEIDERINSWTERKFKFDIEESTISEIGFYITGGMNILFGQFSINKIES